MEKRKKAQLKKDFPIDKQGIARAKKTIFRISAKKEELDALTRWTEWTTARRYAKYIRYRTRFTQLYTTVLEPTEIKWSIIGRTESWRTPFCLRNQHKGRKAFTSVATQLEAMVDWRRQGSSCYHVKCNQVPKWSDDSRTVTSRFHNDCKCERKQPSDFVDLP